MRCPGPKTLRQLHAGRPPPRCADVWVGCAQRAGPSSPPAPNGAQNGAPRRLVAFPPPPPPPPIHRVGGQDAEVWAALRDDRRRIFCNRSLNMASIKAVGFDMDYTLAQYKPETFELLAYTLTVQKLVNMFGYPEQVLDLRFDPSYMMRGLTVDKVNGNVLKLDRHKYAKLVFHGFRELGRQERLAMYHEAQKAQDFDDARKFVQMDTIFSLAEAYLFLQVVDMKDALAGNPPGEPRAGENMLEEKSYKEVYDDIRMAIDMIHRDGSLKREVALNPGRYIHSDENLVPLLEGIRFSGKKAFIVTNSLWDYTNIVMNWLINGRVGADKDLQWLDYFEIVVTGSAKPRFFQQNQEIFQVETGTGHLLNTDEGNPMIDLDSDEEHSLESPHMSHVIGKVFQGGDYQMLNTMLGIESSSDILYVGDHIYGDIVKSKKSIGWRTMLVIPELENEINVTNRHRGAAKELFEMRRERDGVEDQIQRVKWLIAQLSAKGQAVESDVEDMRQEISQLEHRHEALREAHKTKLAALHADFHPVWGQIMKTGYQNSRFACQVDRFACLYTSHVGNLRYYSPNKAHRGLQDEMPHDAIVS